MNIEETLLAQIFDDANYGIAVEVGGYDGVTGSTTHALEKKGWRCIVVEPIPELADKIRQSRNAKLYQVACSNAFGKSTLLVPDGAETLATLSPERGTLYRDEVRGKTMRGVEVVTTPLDAIVMKEEISPREIDLLSIDVEGHEHHVLAGFNLGYFRPKVVILEDNSGGQDTDMQDYMSRAGYRPFLQSGVNFWYFDTTNPAICVRIEERQAKIQTAVARLQTLLEQ